MDRYRVIHRIDCPGVTLKALGNRDWIRLIGRDGDMEIWDITVEGICVLGSVDADWETILSGIVERLWRTERDLYGFDDFDPTAPRAEDHSGSPALPGNSSVKSENILEPGDGFVEPEEFVRLAGLPPEAAYETTLVIPFSPLQGHPNDGDDEE